MEVDEFSDTDAYDENDELGDDLGLDLRYEDGSELRTIQNFVGDTCGCSLRNVLF